MTSHMSENADRPAADSLEGRLLIAMPNIGDPRFERAVIYLFAHRETGAMGLMVNRQTDDLDFRDLLTQLQLEVADGAQLTAVRLGGPVEVERGFVLHSPDYHKDEATLRVDEDISMTATVDVLQAMASGDGPSQALFALGYSGWGPGQLEREIAQNGWLHCEADADIVFGGDDEAKWIMALKKLGIDPLMLSSTAGTA